MFERFEGSKHLKRLKPFNAPGQALYSYLDCDDLHNGFALSKTLVTSGIPQLKSKSKILDS